MPSVPGHHDVRRAGGIPRHVGAIPGAVAEPRAERGIALAQVHGVDDVAGEPAVGSDGFEQQADAERQRAVARVGAELLLARRGERLGCDGLGERPANI